MVFNAGNQPWPITKDKTPENARTKGVPDKYISPNQA